MAFKQLKPSSIPIDGVTFTIKDATQESFNKFKSAETENLIFLTFEEQDEGFRLTAESFLALAKLYNSWTYSEWVGQKVRLYREDKIIYGNPIIMVKVGEKLTRKK